LAVLFTSLAVVGFARGVWIGWRLVVGSAASFVGCVLTLIPLHGYLSQQISSYGIRGSAQLPAQAGHTLSGVADNSIYSLLANLIWALWGYHSDTTMVLITALWPLLILLALVLLGRGRSTPAFILVTVSAVPALVLFVLNMKHPSLFEIRYFIAAVPALMLLIARGITRVTRSGIAAGVASAVLVASFVVGLVDEQVNSSNPRIYDFRGALNMVTDRAEPGDVIAYAPGYLTDEVNYYARDVTAFALVPDAPPLPRPGQHVFVVGSFLDQRNISSGVGLALSILERRAHLRLEVERANVKVWEFTR